MLWPRISYRQAKVGDSHLEIAFRIIDRYHHRLGMTQERNGNGSGNDDLRGRAGVAPIKAE